MHSVQTINMCCTWQIVLIAEWHSSSKQVCTTSWLFLIAAKDDSQQQTSTLSSSRACKENSKRKAFTCWHYIPIRIYALLLLVLTSAVSLRRQITSIVHWSINDQLTLEILFFRSFFRLSFQQDETSREHSTFSSASHIWWLTSYYYKRIMTGQTRFNCMIW